MTPSRPYRLPPIPVPQTDKRRQPRTAAWPDSRPLVRRVTGLSDNCGEKWTGKAKGAARLLIRSSLSPVKNCEGVFRGKGGPAGQLRTHGSARVYRCTHAGCGRQFRQSYRWALHRQTHIKKFSLSAASGRQAALAGCFSQKKIDARSPGVEKLFTCLAEGCHQLFAQRAALYAHMIDHERDNPYACLEEGCKRRFLKRTTLLNHVLAAHPCPGNRLCPTSSQKSSEAC